LGNRAIREAIERGVRDVFEGIPFTSIAVVPTHSKTPATVLEPAEARTLVGPAALFGTPQDASCRHGVGIYDLQCPPKQLYTVSQGRLVGNSSVIDSEGQLYWPDQVATAADLRTVMVYNDHNTQAYVLRDDGGMATAFFYWSGTERRIEGTGLFLPNLAPGNYGSFLFRVLPHLLEAARLGLRFDFFITSDGSHWFPDAIRLVGLPLKPILLVQEIFGHVVSNVTFFNDFCTEDFAPRSTVAALRTLYDKARPSVDTAPSALRLPAAAALAYTALWATAE
jgi:hypothetical protein